MMMILIIIIMIIIILKGTATGSTIKYTKYSIQVVQHDVGLHGKLRPISWIIICHPFRSLKSLHGLWIRFFVFKGWHVWRCMYSVVFIAQMLVAAVSCRLVHTELIDSWCARTLCLGSHFLEKQGILFWLECQGILLFITELCFC